MTYRELHQRPRQRQTQPPRCIPNRRHRVYAELVRCPTTHKLYQPAETQHDRKNGIMWAACEWCDANLRLRGEAGFSRRNKQWHAYRADGGSL